MLPTLKNTKGQAPEFTSDDDIHLWLLDFAQLGSRQIQMATELLPEEELVRARKFIRNPAAAIATRAFVRLGLAPYLNTPATLIEFDKEPKGKPFVAQPQSSLHFNLSHTADYALLAVSKRKFIGVDIEKTERNSDIMSIAKHYFSPHELTQLQQQPTEKQQPFFFRLWTLKEAFLKATGDGITVGLEKVSFTLKQDSIAVELAPELTAANENWQFYQQFISDNLCFAVAHPQTNPLQIQWFDGNYLFSKTLTD